VKLRLKPKARFLQLARLLSLLGAERLRHLLMEASAQASAGDGDFIECGVSRGGTATLLAEVLRHYGSTRILHLVDAWPGFPDPDPIKDGPVRVSDHARLQRACATTTKQVMALLTGAGVASYCRIHRGWFKDVLPQIPGPFALAHVDGDLYQSTRDCLDYLLPRMTARGVIVLDDYGDLDRRGCPGVGVAVAECIAGTEWRVVPLGVREGSAMLIRTRPGG
jgi:O-methyltransferase